MCKTYTCLRVLPKEFPGQIKQKGTLISYICQMYIKSSLQNYNDGQKYLAIFLKNAHFQFLYFSPWKAEHAKIVIVPERADIPSVGAAMFVDFDLRTKILNLSLIDKYQSQISRDA